MTASEHTHSEHLHEKAENEESQPRQLMFPGLPNPRSASYDSFEIGLASRRALRFLIRATRRSFLMEGPSEEDVIHVFWDSLMRTGRFSYSQQISSLQRQVHEIKEHQQRHDHLMENAVRPILARRARELEWRVEERDPIPPAASAEYEWRSHSQKVLATAKDLITEFEDLSTRLSHHVSLTEQLKELLESARSLDNRALRSAVLTVHDALYSIYSEDMTLEQAEAIRDAVECLQNTRWERDKVRDLDASLRKVGFETVPSDKFVSSYNASRSP